MAGNYFDKYDEQPQEVAAPPPQAAPTEGNYFDKYDPPEENLGGEVIVPEDTNWFNRTADRVGETAGGVVDQLFGEQVDSGYDTSNIPDDINAAFGAPEKGMAERAQTAASDTVIAGSETIMDSALTLGRTFLKDEWEDAIIDYSKSTWDKISKSPIMQEGIEAFKAGQDAYKGWAEANPDVSSRLEEVINIGSFGRKPTGKTTVDIKGAPEVPTYGNKPDMTGSRQTQVANAELRNNRKAQIEELMTPDGFRGDGTFDIDKKGNKYYKPTPWEQEINKEVVRTRGVDPKKPVTRNMNIVREKAGELKVELDSYIKTRGNPEIDKQSVRQTLANKVNGLENETLLSGDALTPALKIFKQADELVQASDGTALGLLQARRDLDAWIKGQKPTIFNSDIENGTALATRIIRQEMNALVGKSIKSNKVQSLLDRQHRLLSAGEKMEAKALKEADSRVGRAIQHIENKTGTRIPTTPVAQAAIGTTAAGTAAALGGFPALLSAGSLLAGYKGLRWLSKPEGRIWMAKLTKMVKSDPALREIIGTDRAALVSLLEGMKGDEEDE